MIDDKLLKLLAHYKLEAYYGKLLILGVDTLESFATITDETLDSLGLERDSDDYKQIKKLSEMVEGMLKQRKQKDDSDVKDVSSTQIIPPAKVPTRIDQYEEVDDDDEDDDVIRCPRCGSTNIHFVTKDTGSGIDKSDACCGYLLFGPIGLLCGVKDKKESTTVRKCMKCNHEF